MTFQPRTWISPSWIRTSTPSWGFGSPFTRNSSASRQSLITTLGDASERPYAAQIPFAPSTSMILRMVCGPAAAQGQLAPRTVLVPHQHLENGVVARAERAALALHQLERRARLEGRQRHQARAGDERHQRRERRAGDVEERAAVEVAVVGADADPRARRPGVAQHVVVREHRALGMRGRAGSELDEQQVVRLDFYG